MIKYENRRYILLILLVIIIIVISINYYNYMKQDNNSLIIDYKYDNGKTNYINFENNFKEKQTIKIRNNSSEVKVFSIKWINVKNTLQFQDKFLYKLSCKGSICNQSDFPYLQVPNSDITLLADVYLEIHQEQSFFVSFVYSGFEDSKGYFKGKLVVEEGITDYKKNEEYMKQRAAKKESMNKTIEEYQKMDDQ